LKLADLDHGGADDLAQVVDVGTLAGAEDGVEQPEFRRHAVGEHKAARAGGEAVAADHLAGIVDAEYEAVVQRRDLRHRAAREGGGMARILGHRDRPFVGKAGDQAMGVDRIGGAAQAPAQGAQALHAAAGITEGLLEVGEFFLPGRGRADDGAAIVDGPGGAAGAAQGAEVGHHAAVIEEGTALAAAVVGPADDGTMVVDAVGGAAGTAQRAEIEEAAGAVYETVAAAAIGELADHGAGGIDAGAAAAGRGERGHGV
jgi:hypothetical protein